MSNFENFRARILLLITRNVIARFLARAASN
jgi:hypothetical protein